MNITVIGGSRGTGAQVVRIATEAGHQVTCLSRRGSPAPSPGVRDMIGDALDPARLGSTIDGADAVVLTVGGDPGDDQHRTRVTAAVIKALKQAGIRRLIVHSSLGVGDSMRLMPPPVRFFAKAMLGRALADHEGQEAATVASGLEWTIVRPGGLTDGSATGNVITQETAEGRPMKGRISRADVAMQIVRMLDDPASIGKAFAMGGA